MDVFDVNSDTGEGDCAIGRRSWQSEVHRLELSRYMDPNRANVRELIIMIEDKVNACMSIKAIKPHAGIFPRTMSSK